MFNKIKKIAMLLALAGSLGAAAVPASTTANALPRTPVAAAETTSTVQVHFGHRRHRRFGRIGIYIGRGWWHRRHCRKYLRLYRITGRRYWLWRFRRCVRHRYYW